MMNVQAISDLHGFLPDIPECDLLILAGDYSPTRDLEQEQRFFEGEFSDWLRSISARFIVGIAGNHDFIFEQDTKLAKRLPWIYLQDEEVSIEGVRIYGTPWTPTYGDWAFMKRESDLLYKFDKIPEGLDILVSHGPSYLHLDKTIEGYDVGSVSLNHKVRQMKPGIMICGHVHEDRGIMDDGDTRYYNVSFVNKNLEPQHKCMHIPLKG